MIVKITRDGSVVNTIKLKENKDVFSYITIMEVMQEKEDILCIGELGRANLGTTTLSNRNNMTTNLAVGNGTLSVSEDGSFICEDTGNSEVAAKNLTINGEDMGLKVGLVLYKEGFVLNTGKTGSNLFGITYPAYLSNITTRKIKSSTKSGAKVFSTKKALVAYIEKHKRTMEYTVTEYGYNWSVEYNCPAFEYDYKNKKHKDIEKINTEEIETLLAQINSTEAEKEEEVIPEKATVENVKAEALFRMQKLNLYNNAIKAYRENGKIFMSEFGGILYDLNEEAKKAVEKVQADGYTPYHIVVSHTTIGDLYSVLYVSDNTENWLGERMDKNGDIVSYAYNASDPFLSEYGYSQYICVNGGLQRTA